MPGDALWSSIGVVRDDPEVVGDGLCGPLPFPGKRFVEKVHDCLGELPVVNALPKKGYLGKGDWEREAEREFAATRKKRSGVESCTTNLRHRGLDWVRAHGADGFARAVSLSVIALNLHRIGLILRKRAQRRRRRAA